MDNKKFKDTLLLPKTTFPLKNFNPAETEKKIRELWEERQIYQKVLTSNQDNPSFVLHSGPAYANGRIHLGHVLNNTIKDIIVRFQASQKKYTPFLLGWDTHGLPIEHKVLQIYKDKEINLRQLCQQFALEQVQLQREQLKKLGLFTDYNKYYITLDKNYEAGQLKIFGELVKKGLIYQGFRPIYWSCGHETALAENEIEYLEKKDTSLYFKVNLAESPSFLDKKNVSLLVWTTQPWTIPANQLIAVKKTASYALVKWDNEYLIILEKRVSLLEKWGKEAKIEKVFLGAELLGIFYSHPYRKDMKGYIASGDDFIQEDEGTGLVHLAPPFGAEDFTLAKKEKLIIECPMETNGHFNEKIVVPEFIGKHYSEINKYVISDLTKKNFVAQKEDIIHSYPHDWRDKSPLIYRLTKQWFIKVENIKNELLKSIEEVEWHPFWTKEKMASVISARGDWCLSRQRKWGVPIPVLYQGDEVILEVEIINYTAELFSKHGSDYWFSGNILPILRNKFPHLIDEKTILGEDTMDVWFDSGVSHWCFLKKENIWPASLYMEGQDQFRGWFNSSLITSVILAEKAPYQQVLSHGFVVDEKGQKMSKSLGNVIDPEEIIEKFGADILRLWVVSSDFTKEVKVSISILENIRESYQKIRNTLRFLLSNLTNFPPEIESKKNLEKNLNLVDYYILSKLEKLVEENEKNYQKYNFTPIYSSLLNFCINDLSSFYFEISKDSLYCDKISSLRRKQIITTLYCLLQGILKIISPILPYLAEETYQNIPFQLELKTQESVHLVNYSFALNFPSNIEEELKIITDYFLPLRQDIFQALERVRQEKIITSSPQAHLTICLKEKRKINYSKLNLTELLTVAEVEIKEKKEENMWEGETCFVKVEKTNQERCLRCRNWRELENEICLRCKKTLLFK